MKYAYCTDVGKKRDNNEDALYICSDKEFYIVADGMGGHNAGEIASKKVTEIVSSNLKEKLEKLNQADIISAIEKANKSIFELSEKDDTLKGMGTTIVALTADCDRFIIAHVGDSRAYLISNNEIKKLTMDHSWVQELINTGALTPSEAKDHPHKNVITRAIGISREVKIDIQQSIWNKNDKILLCTDGLTSHVEDSDILNIISQNSDIWVCTQSLIDLANERGGSDNITVVLVENN